MVIVKERICELEVRSEEFTQNTGQRDEEINMKAVRDREGRVRDSDTCPIISTKGEECPGEKQLLSAVMIKNF